MNKEEAKARIEAAEKEIAAAKAALEQAQEPDGRVIMKPSEVPVGEYFRFVDEKPAWRKAVVRYKGSPEHYFVVGESGEIFRCVIIDHRSVYLTDPYGNAIEPCEELPKNFRPDAALGAVLGCSGLLATAFTWYYSKEGRAYWDEQNRLEKISPSAAAKLRGMIHKWNQENGGQG